MADGRHFENHKNRNISATVWPSLRNLVPWCKLGLLTIQTVKNWTSKIQDGRQLPFWQEAQLSPRDRAMRCVSWNLANFHATVEKLLVRQVLNKSKLWSWGVKVGRCVINMCTQPWRDRVAPIILDVINKSTTVELCISPVYRRLAVAKFSKSTM